jgi:hypothetical protein
VEEGEEREEEGEEEGGGNEGEEQEALWAQEVVRRGGGAPLPLHCFALWLAATAGVRAMERLAAHVVMKAEVRCEDEGEVGSLQREPGVVELA